MRGISCPLILIKDDLFFRIHVARTVHPHITLGTATAAIPFYQYRCLISLDDMIAVKQRMKVIIQNGEIFFSQPDHPVRPCSAWLWQGHIEGIPVQGDKEGPRLRIFHS